MEVKSISLGWYEKCDISENELLYAEELLAVDNDLRECDNILSEVGLQTGYSGYENQIYEIAEKRQHLWDFVQALMGYIEIHLDEPLRQKLNHGACETISRIHMADFQVENTLGLTVIPTNREYWGVPQVKDRLNLEDFIGNALGEGADGNRIPGTNHDCVEEFAVIFQQQYDNMLAMGMLGEDPQNLEDYLDQFASMGEYDHKEDQPFYKALLSNVLDLTIIKPLIESCCGYDLITGEDLTEMERNMKVIGALVDLVTLATGIYGFTAAAKNMGWKKAASYFGQLALVELASDVSAATVATIGDYCDWPMGVTMLLSLGTGLTVGQIGNHLIFKRNGIEIFRKEVSESGEFLEDLMSPEDAARFRKFLEEGSTAGLTPEELAGIGKVDDYLALNRVDYDDVLTLRNYVEEGGKSPVVYNDITGMDWYEYYRKAYGKENVCWENCNPSEVAAAWQGDYPYVGVDTYTNIVLHEGDVIWMGEPFPTGYSTTAEAIADLNNDARRIFEGLQVKPYYERGMTYAEYRSRLTPYKVHGELSAANGVAINNPQFGAGGLAQIFDPNFDYNVANGFLERLAEQTIELTNTKISLEDFFNMMNEIK